MTVSELIAKLQTMPQGATVLMHSSNDCGLSNIDTGYVWIKPAKTLTAYQYSSEYLRDAVQAVVINEV